MMKRSYVRTAVLAVFLTLVLAVGMAANASAAPGKMKNLILATTTSTQDSGLLDVLIPIFEKKTGYFVKTIAVGSGQAMAMGAKGEADVLLVHSPAAEKAFMAQGNGTARTLVMHNDFIVVGPPADPATIKMTKGATAAFKNIALSKSLFMSRGDNSGTHAKEKGIWKAAGINPEKEKWYQQTGLGMGQTLNVAAEKKAYTLADRGTYLALKKNLGMDILNQGDAILLNVYSVIPVNPTKFKKINADGAKAFADFILSKDTQKIIGKFGVEKFGSPLFFPDAGKKEESLGK
ncbi:MAG: tungsten ABC transporter substrate-binding protein [Deltaproteobacteria bacterium HGW-Deltaproteobacteria-19]|jgi:tungstate transport system substrate-binding protein|nr:MAG: tungsten ABC transporter substrate-binding protein [Deltaproteobacteria bacterium HGW-Deltaproteobacteria-19]